MLREAEGENRPARDKGASARDRTSTSERDTCAAHVCMALTERLQTRMC